MQQCPVAGVTNYLKVGGLKQQIFILVQFWKPKDRNLGVSRATLPPKLLHHAATTPVPSSHQCDARSIDRVCDELWMEVRDIVQETGIKTIPKIKKCKKAKWLSEEALQIAVKRKEAKSKEEKETYTHLNTEFQRTARRDKKAILSD